MPELRCAENRLCVATDFDHIRVVDLNVDDERRLIGSTQRRHDCSDLVTCDGGRLVGQTPHGPLRLLCELIGRESRVNLVREWVDHERMMGGAWTRAPVCPLPASREYAYCWFDSNEPDLAEQYIGLSNSTVALAVLERDQQACSLVVSEGQSSSARV